ncbi:MAG: hypothetical protein R3B35_06400 [Gemmatimonadales bacterium]
MTTLRRLRALGVVSALWGFLAALLYMGLVVVTSLGAPITPTLSQALIVFGIAWVAGTLTGAVMGVVLMAIARGRPLDRVRRWETFVAGFAAGVAFLILVIGVAGGLTIPDLSMWGTTMLLGAGIFGTATGALTLAFAEVARRGGGAVTAGVGDPAALPPA